MAKLKLTVACGDYEIVRALTDGTVQADGIELVMLTGMGSRERHWRMARKTEFDVCEINIGGYFMARDRGEALAAIPVFLHRRFRHGFVFVNAKCRHPRAEGPDRQEDRRHQFPARLQHLDARHSRRVLRRAAPAVHLGGRARARTSSSRRRRICASKWRRPDKRLDVMLAEGEIPAMLSPDLPRLFRDGDKRIVRLFPNYKDIEIEYFRNTGIFPIMHVTVVAPGDRRQISLGGDQSGQGVRRGQGAGLSPHRQPAHRAAGLDQDRLGGAAGSLGRRSLGLRPRRGQPQEPRDRAALLPPAGPDRPRRAARRVVRRHRSRRCLARKAGRVASRNAANPAPRSYSEGDRDGSVPHIGRREHFEHLVADQRQQDRKLGAQALQQTQHIAARVNLEALVRRQPVRAASPRRRRRARSGRAPRRTPSRTPPGVVTALSIQRCSTPRSVSAAASAIGTAEIEIDRRWTAPGPRRGGRRRRVAAKHRGARPWPWQAARSVPA